MHTEKSTIIANDYRQPANRFKQAADLALEEHAKREAQKAEEAAELERKWKLADIEARLALTEFGKAIEPARVTFSPSDYKAKRCNDGLFPEWARGNFTTFFIIRPDGLDHELVAQICWSGGVWYYGSQTPTPLEKFEDILVKVTERGDFGRILARCQATPEPPIVPEAPAKRRVKPMVWVTAGICLFVVVAFALAHLCS